jgi:predicted nucleotide-binding protein (sugar kinase/HSP70/actin superfamily)
VCVPFKYNLGTFIEALETGADMIGQVGGGCRFAYYAEVIEAILADLGYDFDSVRLTGSISPLGVYRDFKRYNPKLTFGMMKRQFTIAKRQVNALDAVDEVCRMNAGFELEPGAHERVVDAFIAELEQARDMEATEAAEKTALARLAQIEVRRPERPLRVGIVGELYVLMEPFSNYFIERELARFGVEVHRFITLSHILTHVGGLRHVRYLRGKVEQAGPYLRYHIGADGTESVAMTYQLMQDGFDGVIHLKPFGCMPEVNAMAALQRISREHTFPILFMSFDAQTSETGVRTRLEAFCDMLQMRRRRTA